MRRVSDPGETRGGHSEVVVIGAGASGIGVAVRLLEAGVEDFCVLEKADRLGGTWRDNTYPGCACDVPSLLYSYSFEPNPDWTRAFAGQEEILDYLEGVADRRDVRSRMRFETEVLTARWDAPETRWVLDTTSGPMTANVLVSASGPWHEPLIPEIDGLASFPGDVFHSSRWDHDAELDGKRVAVVGTGASAVQFVPAIQPQVERLDVFQRTAQWVLPKPDMGLPGPVRTLINTVPGASAFLKSLEYGAMETLGIGFRHPEMMRVVQQIGVAHLRLAVRDPELRKTLTPSYTLGCKRTLMSNSYLQALTRPNVEVHPIALDHVDGSTLVGTDGREVEADVLVFGTGFHITDMPIAEKVRDAEGVTLVDRWEGHPQAYLGTSVAGFPNLFLLLGPNLGTGHSSAFAILEPQIAHVVEAITSMRDRGWSAVEVRRDAQDAFNAEVQGALPSTVYNAGGCNSYYFDVTGQNSFSWPWSTGELRRRVSHFDEAAYRVTESVPATA